MTLSSLKTESSSLPMKRLREIYKNNIRVQKVLSHIPVYLLLVAFALYVFKSYLLGPLEGLMTMAGLVDFIFLAVCGILMTSKSEKVIAFLPAVMILEAVVKYVAIKKISIFTYLMIAYVIVSAVILFRGIKILNYLRTLPDFPFDERTETIKNMEMSRQKVADDLNREKNGGVGKIDYEKIFTVDNPEEYVTGKVNQENKLQQNVYKKYSDKKNQAYLEKMNQAHKDDLSGEDEFLHSGDNPNGLNKREMEKFKAEYADFVKREQGESN